MAVGKRGWPAGRTPRNRTRCVRSADDVGVREELSDLELGVLEAVRTVDRILADAFGVELADRAVRGLGRAGGAHDFAVAGDGVVAFQTLNHHRRRRHELHELAEE